MPTTESLTPHCICIVSSTEVRRSRNDTRTLCRTWQTVSDELSRSVAKPGSEKITIHVSDRADADLGGTDGFVFRVIGAASEFFRLHLRDHVFSAA